MTRLQLLVAGILAAAFAFLLGAHWGREAALAEETVTVELGWGDGETITVRGRIVR